MAFQARLARLLRHVSKMAPQELSNFSKQLR